jgi:hypothetical protein
MVDWMVIKFFQSPSDTPTPLDGNRNFSLPMRENRARIVFFPNDNMWPTLFDYHLMMEIFQMAIEIFHLPKTGAHVISFLKKNHPHHTFYSD